MIKKTTNKVDKVTDVSSDRDSFIRDTATNLLLTLTAVNGKINPDYPKLVTDAATALADKLDM